MVAQVNEQTQQQSVGRFGKAVQGASASATKSPYFSSAHTPGPYVAPGAVAGSSSSRDTPKSQSASHPSRRQTNGAGAGEDTDWPGHYEDSSDSATGSNENQNHNDNRTPARQPTGGRVDTATAALKSGIPHVKRPVHASGSRIASELTHASSSRVKLCWRANV